MVKHMDDNGVERQMVIPNYGIPDSTLSFKYNPLVVDSLRARRSLRRGDLGLADAQGPAQNREAIKHAGDKGVKALKITCLLGGTYKVADWDEETKALWEELIDCCEANNLVFHMHTSPGGTSDISNLLTFIREYGKRIRIYVVHMGGGVSGQHQVRPRSSSTSSTRATRSTATSRGRRASGRAGCSAELQERGEAWDRIMFAATRRGATSGASTTGSRTPNISEELKDRLFYQNAADLYDSCGLREKK